MKKSGCFITFEGGDGAGKSTLIETIHQYLEKTGRSVLKTRAPGGTRVGEIIRSLLLTKTETPLSDRGELFLFLADRAQHVQEIIKPALDKGCIVLCDRYNDSTVAYQGTARGFDPDWTRSLCNFATHDLQPDLTLYLDIDPKVGLSRVLRLGNDKDRIESEGLAFHEKIRKAFHKIAKQDSERFKIIDASLSTAEVFEHALAKINYVL
ncbi:MAG: dTMP kinase [Chlamydiae bacterium]|nr:dTMP kinase [Chlamydiota bacterium]